MTTTELISQYEARLIKGQIESPEVFVASVAPKSPIDVATRESLSALFELHAHLSTNSLPDGFHDRQLALVRRLIAAKKEAGSHRQGSENLVWKRWHPIVLLLWTKGPSNQVAEEIVGRTRMAKETFLLVTETLCSTVMANFYYAKAGAYGPDNRDLFQDLESLRDLHLIEIVPPSKATGKRMQIHEGLLEDEENTIYRLTDKGKEFAIKLADRVHNVKPELLLQLETIKRCWNRKPLKGTHGLVTYVYKKYQPIYPELFTKSEIIHEILGDEA